MNTVKCKLFGAPEILYDDKPVSFPYKKAEALLYYFIIKKQAFRDMLVELFWGSVDEEVARKSLRNAVYVINKAFDYEVLISPKRAIVQLNPDLCYEADIYQFAADNEDCSIELYTGEFLEGFMVKDAEGFDKWQFSQRNSYRDEYLKKLHKVIQLSVRERQLDRIERYCKLLIAADEFNEKAYRTLMNTYRKTGQYDRCIEVYNTLSKLLKSELSIAPDPKTNELLSEILNERIVRQIPPKSEEEMFFYGRQKELKNLNDTFYEFFSSGSGKSIVIEGEAGIGKTALIEKHLSVVKTEQVFLVKTVSYQIEESYPLKTWHDILLQLSHQIETDKIELPLQLKKIISHVFPGISFDLHQEDEKLFDHSDWYKQKHIESAIIETLKIMTERKKLLLVLEDIHWIDKMSLELIHKILLNNKNKTIMILCNFRKGYMSKLGSFISDAKARGVLEQMELERFNRNETEAFARKIMENLNMEGKPHSRLYDDTEGNPFFIVEYVNTLREHGCIEGISPKIHDILKSRFLNVSEEGQKILNIASCFMNQVSLEELLLVSEKSEMELLDILSELEEKNLIREVGETKNVCFVFTHQKLQDFVYSQLTGSKKRILHMRIAKLLETRLQGFRSDCIQYARLIHHYSCAGNRLMTIKYSIKKLEYFLEMNHEIFPVFPEDGLTLSAIIEMSEEQIREELKHIQGWIYEVRAEEGGSVELDKLELSLLHMLGRRYICTGQYPKGMETIRRMIDKAKRLKETAFALKGYRQIIYFCINTYNVRLMESYIEEAIQLAEQYNFNNELNILMRLKGLHHVMDGRYTEGEELLRYSISLFEAMEDKEEYLLNIAAAYNFIGESRRKRMEFLSAIQYYEKAIAICTKNGFPQGLPIIYTNAGQAAYDMGNAKKAKEYFKHAVNAYTKNYTIWGRTTACGYLSLLLVKEGDFNEARAYMEQAEHYAKLEKNPYEKALLYRAQGEIKKESEREKEVYFAFSDILGKKVIEYCDAGIKLLHRIKNCYEEDLLKNLRDSCL